MNLGFGEIVLILVVVLLVFGAKKLPELGRAMGLGLKEFKKAVKEVDTEEEKTEKPKRKKKK
jgi:sec-independent protein translocase protein TatA